MFYLEYKKTKSTAPEDKLAAIVIAIMFGFIIYLIINKP